MRKEGPLPEVWADLTVRDSNRMPAEHQDQPVIHETSYDVPMDDDLEQAMDIDEECTTYQATIEQMELQDCSGSATIDHEASSSDMAPETTIEGHKEGEYASQDNPSSQHAQGTHEAGHCLIQTTDSAPVSYTHLRAHET